ncbi:threonylcarbamoyl-AMP synthase, partial [Streptococcus pseudopneumoniae]
MKVSCDETGIKQAVKTINDGGVIVFPTDTVYGIGCDPYNFKAVNSIYEIKKRESD